MYTASMHILRSHNRFIIYLRSSRFRPLEAVRNIDDFFYFAVKGKQGVNYHWRIVSGKSREGCTDWP